ncbi:MAG TPA: F0F1 ATP synthase subunit B' [Rhodospirillaceae bacterium]|nr:F0F1 ATP synthase subunit B' [Rhodospirillaceae bacterium]HAT34383.1 F0F1 ATP synthase subunit B' [Rhodospirillaceae bacterium]
MPQLDPTFFPTQLFWLVVIFTLLFLIVWKVALPRIAGIRETRRTRIDTDLEKAGVLKEEAEGVLAAYEKSLAEATGKAQAVHRSVADELLAERNRRLDEVAESLAGRLREAEAEIAAEEERAAQEISSVSAELVQLATEQLGTGKTTEKDANTAVKAVLEGAK